MARLSASAHEAYRGSGLGRRGVRALLPSASRRSTSSRCSRSARDRRVVREARLSRRLRAIPVGVRVDAEPLPAPRLVRLRHGIRRRSATRRRLRRLYRDWAFFSSLVENLEMTLAKSSLEIAEGYLELVHASPDRERLFAAIVAEHERTVSAVLGIVEASELLDRHPVLQRSVRLRNPYVDPMNAIQVELLRRVSLRRGGRDQAAPPLDRRDRRRSAEHRLTRRRGTVHPSGRTATVRASRSR